MSETVEWKLISEYKPSPYVNVLLAFNGHWNQVVGFLSPGEKLLFYETSAHDCNTPIADPQPKWWTEIPEVPHKP